MINYIVALGLFLQLIVNSGQYKEKFVPTTKTISYVITDPSAFNKNHTYILTDEFLGIKDFPELHIKNAYVYNEHSTDMYNNHLHWEDSPMILVLSKGYWYRLSSLRWKNSAKNNIVYIPPMEIQDDNIDFNWMPEKLWVGELWKGAGDAAAQHWTHEMHKVVDHRNGVWYIHSISIYLHAPSAMASCYDERWKNGVEIYQKMTDCHDHLIGEMHVK